MACSAGKSPTSTDAAADSGGEVGGDSSAPETRTDVDAMAGDVVSSAPVPCADGGAGVVLATTTAPATPANLTSDGTNIYFTTKTNGGGASGLADSVMMIPLAGGTPKLLASGQNAPSFAGASYIEVAGGSLYWAASSAVFPNPPTLWTIPVGGGTQLALDSSPNSFRGLIASGATVYYGAVPNLKSITPPSTTPAPLTSAFYGFDLAFDGSKFYWHDGRDGMPDNITEVPLSGGTPSILANTTGNAGDYSDIVADATTIYWGALLADQSAAVKSIPVAGGAQTIFAHPLAFSTDALALDDKNVYIIVANFLWKKPKAGGPMICLATTKTGSDANMVVDANNIYWPDQQTGRIMKVAK
ncbi:MAG TPA: hypothetical protein VGY54_21940 [Polyangiaceae bacterium]|nr:hypothetical protein [Polyangiaceae bacterium]